MTDQISHEGIVDTITDKEIVVRILQTSACSHCKATAYCNSSESKVKTIHVARQSKDLPYQVGEKVIVLASLSVASKALLLCFGIPFLLIVLTLVSMMTFTENEIVSALVALSSLIPYYMVLYFFRNEIGKKVSFNLQSIGQ